MTRVDKIHNLIQEYGRDIIHIVDDSYGKGLIAEALTNYPCYFSTYIVHGRPIQVRLIFAFFDDWSKCVFITIFIEKNDSVDYSFVIKNRVDRRVKEYEKIFGKCSRRY